MDSFAARFYLGSEARHAGKSIKGTHMAIDTRPGGPAETLTPRREGAAGERVLRIGQRATLHAINLYNPSHMEWTRDGRLLVCEHTAGRIVDITTGGDMKHSEPFAFRLEGPAAIVPQDDRILVSESWSGKVTALPLEGGDATRAQAYAEGLRHPYGLSQDREGRLFVSEKVDGFRSQVTEISDGLDGKRRTFVANIPTQPAPPGRTPLGDYPVDEWDRYSAGGCSDSWPDFSGPDRMLTVGELGIIVRLLPDGGDLLGMLERHASEVVVAWGLGRTAGMKYNPADGTYYVAQPQQGSVLAIDPDAPANYVLTPPVVRGLNQPSCVRFSPRRH